MKWAIVFYAIFSYPDGSGMEEHISWGVTFGHHEQCIASYTNNKDLILDGINTFAKNHYGQEMTLMELGCAHATANFDVQDKDPQVTLKMPLYRGQQT
jgi:hypothetical protein